MAAFAELRRLDPGRADALLAGTLLVLAQAEIWLVLPADDRAATSLAAAVITSALAGRRRWPLATTCVVMAAILALALTAGLPNAVFLMPTGLVALYSLGAYARPDRAVVGLAGTMVGLPLGSVRIEDPTVTDLTAPVILFASAWVAGRAMEVRRQRDGELRRVNEALLRDQATREALAVDEERARIARELHDIVAHRVTTIVVQAESGSYTVHDPDEAQRTFQTIARSGRESLAELRRLLGVLGESTSSMSPLPGVARVDQLVADTRLAGLEVDLHVDTAAAGLSPGLDLAVYRIVQEALTNALRHGTGAATVGIARTAHHVVVEVTNPVGNPANGYGAGRGLGGMRERVRLYDGEVTAQRENGRWVVAVRLPATETSR